MSDINHPQYYGGDTTYEAIKVIEAWKLGFCLGNTVKYISRAGKKDVNAELHDLEKAAWYLNREIETIKKSRKMAEDFFHMSIAPQLKPGTRVRLTKITWKPEWSLKVGELGTCNQLSPTVDERDGVLAQVKFDRNGTFFIPVKCLEVIE